MIGVIAAAYELAHSSAHPDATVNELRRWLTWFETHLAVPDRFNRTKSKSWYRRDTHGISWLRAGATEHVTR